MIAATTADGVASSNQEIPGPDAVGSRSAVEALPIRYPTDTLGLREPLPFRYQTATDPLPLACSPGACIAGSAGPVLPAIMRINRPSLTPANGAGNARKR